MNARSPHGKAIVAAAGALTGGRLLRSAAPPSRWRQPPDNAAAPFDPAGLRDLLAQHRGRVVLVDFWATWCQPCVEWFPHAVDLQQRLAGRGLSVISLSMDDSDQPAAVQDFLRRQQAASENFINRDGVSAESFDEYQIPSGLPHLKLYDRRGKLRKTFAAGALPIDARQIQRAVEELLDEGA